MNYPSTHAVAGFVAGMVSTSVLHPMDLVKTRLQVQDGVHVPIKYNGIMHAFSKITAEEGVKGLYRGLGYEYMKGGCIAVRRRMGMSTVLSPFDHMFSAITGGAVVTTISNPIWLVKTRLVLMGNKVTPGYSGTISALRHIFVNEGFKGLFKGLGPSLIGTSHGAVQFMAYEELKRLRRVYRHDAPPTLDAWEGLLIGSMAKMIAAVATYPYQVVRSRLQQIDSHYTGLCDAVVKILRREGVRGVYKGLLISVIRVTPQASLVFLTYESILGLLLKANIHGDHAPPPRKLSSGKV